MFEDFPIFKAAAVQASPVFLDKARTIEKTCRLIEEASQNGAKLIVFPETYIPTYPYWAPDGPGMSGRWLYSWRELLRNSVEIPSRDTDLLCQAAKRARAYLAVGLNERDRNTQGTIYNTILFIDKDGKIMGSHRKLIPTAHERLYWGRGYGSGLRVIETEYGRLGGLICAEHFMTLSKYAMFAKGEQIHCALWPGWPGWPKGGIKFSVDVASRQYALEGQVWVILASSYIREDLIPDDFPYKKSTNWVSFGGSGIIGPRGTYVAGPVYGEEAIVYGEINMGEIPLAKATIDVAGHYARLDVANLNLNEEELAPYKPMKRAPLPKEYHELKAAVANLLARIRERAYPELEAEAEDLATKMGELIRAEGLD